MKTWKRSVVSTCLVLGLLVAGGCGQGGQQTSAPAPPYGSAPSQPQGVGLELEKQSQRFKELLAQDPGNANAWIGLGNLYMDNRRFPEAVDAYGKALAITPNNTDVRVDRGTCYRGMGQPQKAVEEYAKALAVNPNHVNGLLNSGIVYAYDLQNLPAAIPMFEKFVQVAPTHPQAPQFQQELVKMKEALRTVPAAHK